MIKKYENLGIICKSNNPNILDFAKNIISNKINSSFSNKNLSKQRNKRKNKKEEKNKNNLFKTINILHQNKKDYKNIKQPIIIKNNKNEINIKLNLNYALLNNINNINNIQKYNNFFNKKRNANNYLNNSSSLEEIIKEKEESSKKDTSKKTKAQKCKSNKKRKNLSQINLNNLINNKFKINSVFLPKNRSTVNINSSKNIYNRRYNSEKNINNLINKINLLYESNYTNIGNRFGNNIKRTNIKNINKFNIKLPKSKSCNKYINSNYNNYNNYCIKNKKNNKWTYSYDYKNIYKNSDIILKVYKNRNYKTARNYEIIKKNVIKKNQNYKKDEFNLILFDDIYNKMKRTLEKFKNNLEKQIEKKKI